MIKKIKITLTSSNKKTLYFYNLFLKKLFNKFNIKYNSISLPVTTKKISLLKSPHVYKKAWEHFKVSKYKISFFLSNSNLTNTQIFLFLKNKVKNINLKIKTLN